ncbi:hypothetical protein LFM09_46770 [Lentzea alba]|uniref:hypothetical protein n=1 Tax=Lentzea alba TaxID=2714351 RepID=UPI0039BFA665
MRNILIGMVVGAATMASIAPAQAIIGGETVQQGSQVQVSSDERPDGGTVVEVAVVDGHVVNVTSHRPISPNHSWIDRSTATS